MRNLTFSKKDFAAIYMMTKPERDQIRDAVAKKVKALGLKPERRRHGIKFKDDDLYIKGAVKHPISFSTNVADILRYIDNVEKNDSDESKAACNVLCKLYVLTK